MLLPTTTQPNPPILFSCHFCSCQTIAGQTRTGISSKSFSQYKESPKMCYGHYHEMIPPPSRWGLRTNAWGFEMASSITWALPSPSRLHSPAKDFLTFLATSLSGMNLSVHDKPTSDVYEKLVSDHILKLKEFQFLLLKLWGEKGSSNRIFPINKL